MIVYRDQRSRADPRRRLLELRAFTHRYAGTAPPHEAARDALITAGKLEAAVADALFPESDGTGLLTRAFRTASIMAGHVLWHTWHGTDESVIWWSRLSRQLHSIPEQNLPREVEVAVPEGYAHYAVYPEMYLEAAKAFHRDSSAGPVVCIGLRSIGTSLSGVVTAALEELGHAVESATLRPRGHPFSRHPCLTGELEGMLRSNPASHFLIVDEGPGLSGSSFAGTAALLRSWGVADEQIVILPSWKTDGSNLRSGLARDSWTRHRQFAATFEDVWLRSGRLHQEFPGEMVDVSGGEWREALYPDAAGYPAVQPQHERRKYLLRSGKSTTGLRMLKFFGLGDEAAKKMGRAATLAEFGYTPKPEGFAHGFLLYSFVPGSPIERGRVEGQLLDRVASYLAHLARENQAEPTVSCGTLQEMIAVNLDQGLGATWPGYRHPDGEWAERVVSLDGRMLAHEWIRTSSGYLKLDALDHHDDHFFPGCQDIAWDLAGAAIELELNGNQGKALIERYQSLSGDQTIRRRLPFYSMAYLSFRLGYCSLAAEVLGETPDGCRFRTETGRYRQLIERNLSGGLHRCAYG